MKTFFVAKQKKLFFEVMNLEVEKIQLFCTDTSCFYIRMNYINREDIHIVYLLIFGEEKTQH